MMNNVIHPMSKFYNTPMGQLRDYEASITMLYGALIQDKLYAQAFETDPESILSIEI